MSRSLLRALWAIGLDRKRLSIHEMLTDILEVVAVAQGLKPAHLSGQGERAQWQIDGFERVALEFGLHTKRTPALHYSAQSGDVTAGAHTATFQFEPEDSNLAAAPSTAAEVLWIYRDAALASPILRLAGGESSLVSIVLGYPDCCTHWEMQMERHADSAMQQARTIAGDIARSRAARAGDHHPHAAMHGLDGVWRTRLMFPYLGYTACRHCLGWADVSASAVINRNARKLAFSLDPEYAHGIWKSAREEAALATTGNCRSLDPAPDDPCPCGSARSYGACCRESCAVMPEFR